jgi:hypothetical protein
MSKTVFIAPKLKELELVRVPMGLKDSQGNKKAPVKYHFTPKEYGTGFETDDSNVIKWLREHDYFKSGRIIEAKPEDLKIKQTESSAVVQGGISSVAAKAKAKAEEKVEIPAEVKKSLINEIAPKKKPGRKPKK